MMHHGPDAAPNYCTVLDLYIADGVGMFFVGPDGWALTGATYVCDRCELVGGRGASYSGRSHPASYTGFSG